MSTATYYADGKPITLGQRIGKGGEGEVYALGNDPKIAFKRYTVTDTKEREAKVRAMVMADLAASSAQIAYPVQIVQGSDRRFAGFLMRLVSGHKPLHEIYSPGSRKQNFPKADYRILVRAALNITRVVAQVHRSGCVIGDINHSGILISPQATAALIDADSFQYSANGRRFQCKVGVPEYTPPELQGQSLSSVTRTPDHDTFGLAVVIFQLLFMGRHPFAGRYSGSGEMPMEKAIGEYRFAYSRARQTDMVPPLGACGLEDFPRAVGTAFEAAFSPKHRGSRPSAENWVGFLQELEKTLRVCAHSKLHHHSSVAPDCPWCEMEARTGSALFLPPDDTFDYGDKSSGFSIAAFVATVEAIKIPPALRYNPNITAPRPQPSSGLMTETWITALKDRWGSLVAFGLALLSLFSNPESLGVPLVLGGIGVWVWIASGGSSVTGTLLSRHRSIDKQISDRVTQIQNAVPIDAALQRKAALSHGIDTYRKLQKHSGSAAEIYAKRRKSLQLEAHLDRLLLRRAKLSQISDSTLAELASNGIETALDVKRRDVQAVRGIGPVRATTMADWVRKVEKKFRFQPNMMAEDHRALAKLKHGFAVALSGQEDILKKELNGLRDAMQKVEAALKRTDSELERLSKERAQVEADIETVGGTVPVTSPLPAARQTPAVPEVRFSQSSPVTAPLPPNTGATTIRKQVRQKTASSAPNCPSCGAPMIKKKAMTGFNAGGYFWGCPKYPRCRGTRRI